MMLIQDFAAYRATGLRGPAAVTIGNFDGCHLGHQALIKAAVEGARSLGGRSVCVCFSPRPEAFFRNLTRETLLFTDGQKIRALTESGLDATVLKGFDAPFSRMGPDSFYDTCLKRDLDARIVVVGHNFRFGRDRTGDAALLSDRGRVDGLEIVVGKAVAHAGERISSTRIRAQVAAGQLEDVGTMLGRPYVLEGKITKGDQLGRKLGVPTANLESVEQIVPRYGIYAGYVWLSQEATDMPSLMTVDRAAVPAVFSIGMRPTLGQIAPPLRVEAHLLRGTYGPDALYGKRAGYYLRHRLRDELKFEDLEALKAQMARDIEQARRLLD